MAFKQLFKNHWHAVISYCAVFWSFGMCVAFLGPTILDLGCRTSSDMKSISWVFFAQLLCSLIGASGSGYLVERKLISPIGIKTSCDANYLILVATILIPVSMVLVPFCKALTGLAIVLGVMGLNMGIIDCLANLQMIHLFGESVAPFLQAMHFCYGLGAFVSPMIAEPFLLNEDCSPFIDNVTDKGMNGLMEPSIQQMENDSSLPAHSLKEAQHMSEVQYAFWIMAATQLPIPFLVLSLVVTNKMRGLTYKHQQLENEVSPTGLVPTTSNEYGSIDKNSFQDSESKLMSSSSSSASASASSWTCSTKCQVIMIAAATSAMVFLYDGLQSAFGGYVYSYALKSIVGLNKTEGAYLNALFWGTFALGRLFSIPLALRFSPACMLLCNVIGSLFATTLMLLLRHDHSSLYVGTVALGIFLSSVTPNAIALAEQHIDLTSRITSIIVVMGAVGEMICPVIVGNMFVLVGPVSFVGFCEVICGFSICVYFVLWFVGRKTPKTTARGPTSFIWCHYLCCAKTAKFDEDTYKDLDQEKFNPKISLDSNGTMEMTNVNQKPELNTETKQKGS